MKSLENRSNEQFARQQLQWQVAGGIIVGMAAWEGLNAHTVVPGFVAAGIIGTANAIVEAYRYRKFESNMRK